jgi:hypothetical protein
MAAVPPPPGPLLGPPPGPPPILRAVIVPPANLNDVDVGVTLPPAGAGFGAPGVGAAPGITVLERQLFHHKYSLYRQGVPWINAAAQRAAAAALPFPALTRPTFNHYFIKGNHPGRIARPPRTMRPPRVMKYMSRAERAQATLPIGILATANADATYYFPLGIRYRRLIGFGAHSVVMQFEVRDAPGTGIIDDIVLKVFTSHPESCHAHRHERTFLKVRGYIQGIETDPGLTKRLQ